MEIDRGRKIDRLNRALNKSIQAIFLQNPRYNQLSVKDVLADPTFKTARVWLTGPKNQIELVVIERTAVQRKLSNHLKLRETPKLTFVVDDRYLEHIEELFNTIEKPPSFLPGKMK